MERLHVANFEQVASTEKNVFVIKFSSPTCGPCHSMAPIVEEFDKNNPRIKVYEVDTMESPEIAAHFGVRGVPHISFCENREVIYNITGLTPLKTLQFVADNINDTYLRTYGHFKRPETKKTWWYEISLTVVISLLAFMIFFYRA
ncbi:MAG: thioredoxin family protein [Bacteriovoracaceae bacterium]|nr:thioredoxin family protein [Bacteriovoracaceae bacterium]